MSEFQIHPLNQFRIIVLHLGITVEIVNNISKCFYLFFISTRIAWVNQENAMICFSSSSVHPSHRDYRSNLII